jgi:hypothetical protein
MAREWSGAPKAQGCRGALAAAQSAMPSIAFVAVHGPQTTFHQARTGAASASVSNFHRPDGRDPGCIGEHGAMKDEALRQTFEHCLADSQEPRSPQMPWRLSLALAFAAERVETPLARDR